MFKARPFYVSLSLIMLWLGTVVAADACSVPVFRYALDRWAADAYQLVVPASLAQRPELSSLLEQLRSNPCANLEIRTADTSDNQVRLHPPAPLDKPVWSGTLTPQVLQNLADSPLRRQILKKILSGDSAVWVVIESGNNAADNKASAALEKRLTYIESVATLPEIDPNDPTSNVGPGPALKVKFSVLRVSRSDPAEKILVSMLTSTPPGDEPPPPANQPLAAAVFGRGKILGLVNIANLPTDTIDEMCLFLLGACSCEAKEANPGWDMLMTVDWDNELAATEQPNKKQNAAGQRSGDSNKNQDVVSVTVTGSEPMSSASNQNQVIAITGGTLLLGLAAGIVLRSGRQPPR